MKKIFFLIVCLGGLTILSVKSVFADTLTCNQKCDVNEDCGTGYKCYVGICRRSECPSSPTCGCNTQPSPSLNPKVRRIDSTPMLRATPVATTSSAIATTPTTGFSFISFLMYGMGAASIGAGLKYVANSNILKPLSFEGAQNERNAKKKVN